ncbi:Mechanosensitive ion channel-domain-containing protein [Kalaharituber pfeilii]|nr:Mechanosensitive ion channel-domain-containing protein [Kalaharituber pfeilii]
MSAPQPELTKFGYTNPPRPEGGYRSQEDPKLAPLQIPHNKEYNDDYSPNPVRSPSQNRHEKHRLNDDLELMNAERVASKVSRSSSRAVDISRSRSKGHRSRSPEHEPMDEFDMANPVHQTSPAWVPPKTPKTKVAVLIKHIHESSVLVRYFTYIVPVVLVLLIPILLAALVFPEASVGDVEMMWFCVWLMIVWLSLWAGRILAKLLPYPFGILASAFSNSSRKWRDMAVMLELPATLFFWWLAVFISFLPTMTNHHIDGDKSLRYWENRVNVVILSLFVAMVLNFIEKIIIQLIAISFHQRTYEDRIVLNKFQLGSIAKLYMYSKAKLVAEVDEGSPNLSGNSRAPMRVLQQAKTNAQTAFHKVGDVFGKVAGDFTGRKVPSSGSPERVVLTLLQSVEGSQALARRLFSTFVKDGCDTISPEDLREGFDSDEEAEAAFQMFDRDLNGDISCEEMELSIVEVGRERKAITASLKDLDSVIGKLDNAFSFLVTVITILVFLSLISTSTAAIISSASGTILALSWLFSATAQEFLASIIFVFVKHPFDVGDRVDIINTGAGTGDTFYVKEIALMYTEFRKLQGHVVQAPNSLLNTLFILNMRRSGALAEGVPIDIKFGTTLDQIEELRQRMLEFVTSERREYQPKILTELVDIPSMHSVKLNVVFFYKSNWQNELVRLSRRNKFMCALMENVNLVGIESPNMRWPGQKPNAPVYLQAIQTEQLAQSVVDRDLDPNTGGTGAVTAGISHFPFMTDPMAAAAPGPAPGPSTSRPDHDAPTPTTTTTTTTTTFPHSILRHTSTASHLPAAHSNTRARSSSLHSTTGRRVDFSLGVSDQFLLDDSDEIFLDRKRHKNPGNLPPQILGRGSSIAHSSAVDLGRPGSADDAHRQQHQPAGSRSRVMHRWGSRARKESLGSTESRGNRFFGLTGGSAPATAATREDLESGHTHGSAGDVERGQVEQLHAVGIGAQAMVQEKQQS